MGKPDKSLVRKIFFPVLFTIRILALFNHNKKLMNIWTPITNKNLHWRLKENKQTTLCAERYTLWYAGWRCFRSTRPEKKKKKKKPRRGGGGVPLFGRFIRQELRLFSLRRQAAGCQRLHLHNERFRRGNDGAADLPLRWEARPPCFLVGFNGFQRVASSCLTADVRTRRRANVTASCLT